MLYVCMYFMRAAGWVNDVTVFTFALPSLDFSNTMYVIIYIILRNCLSNVACNWRLIYIHTYIYIESYSIMILDSKLSAVILICNCSRREQTRYPIWQWYVLSFKMENQLKFSLFNLFFTLLLLFFNFAYKTVSCLLSYWILWILIVFFLYENKYCFVKHFLTLCCFYITFQGFFFCST